MLNLVPHRRLHVPHGLAVFAVLLLIASGFVGYEINREAYSNNQKTLVSTKAGSTEGAQIDDAVENRSRGLKLGLLLFRR